MARKTKETPTNLYASFETPEFFDSGSLLLDLALGGGLGENSIINIIGDSSTGKTLLAIIASKNYNTKYPKRPIHYVEAEARFNPAFAQALNFPIQNVSFPPDILTVEALFEFADSVIKENKPALIIVDSLDALSTEEEMEGEFTAGYHGARKAERMSALFRELKQRLSKAHVTVIIISQTRQKIGVMFGRKWTRAGGNALTFYASQIIVLAPMGKLVKTISKITRPIGVMTKALVDKNSFGAPYRDAMLPILFERGIDDYKACIDWLKKISFAPDIAAGATWETVKDATISTYNLLESKFRDTPVYSTDDSKEEASGDE